MKQSHLLTNFNKFSQSKLTPSGGKFQKLERKFITTGHTWFIRLCISVDPGKERIWGTHDIVPFCNWHQSSPFCCCWLDFCFPSGCRSQIQEKYLKNHPIPITQTTMEGNCLLIAIQFDIYFLFIVLQLTVSLTPNKCFKKEQNSESVSFE